MDTVLRYAVMRTTITLSSCRPLSFPLCHCVQPTPSWALSSFSNAAPLRKFACHLCWRRVLPEVASAVTAAENGATTESEVSEQSTKNTFIDVLTTCRYDDV